MIYRIVSTHNKKCCNAWLYMISLFHHFRLSTWMFANSLVGKNYAISKYLFCIFCKIEPYLKTSLVFHKKQLTTAIDLKIPQLLNTSYMNNRVFIWSCLGHIGHFCWSIPKDNHEQICHFKWNFISFSMPFYAII